MNKIALTATLPLLYGTICSCSPTVKVEAPDKPIVVNLNVKIEHKVKLRIQKELDDVISNDSELF